MNIIQGAKTTYKLVGSIDWSVNKNITQIANYTYYGGSKVNPGECIYRLL